MSKRMYHAVLPFFLLTYLAHAQVAIDAPFSRAVETAEKAELVIASKIELRSSRQLQGSPRELTTTIALDQRTHRKLEEQRELLKEARELQSAGQKTVLVKTGEKIESEYLGGGRLKRTRVPVLGTVTVAERVKSLEAEVQKLRAASKSCVVSLESDDAGFNILPKTVQVDLQRSKALTKKEARGVLAFSFKDKAGQLFNGKIVCDNSASFEAVQSALGSEGADLSMEAKATRVREGHNQQAPASSGPAIL